MECKHKNLTIENIPMTGSVVHVIRCANSECATIVGVVPLRTGFPTLDSFVQVLHKINGNLADIKTALEKK